MIDYQAIHGAYHDYKTKVGNYATPAIPQPVAHGSAHTMMIHAMAMNPNKDGETHGTMILRALTEHLKRVTPDVNSIHKGQATPELAPKAPLMGGQ